MKRVLIITYYWPPSGGAGVQRWLKFVKYLRDFGWEPIVYTPENPEYPALDPTLENDIPNNLEVIKYPIWEPYSFYKRVTGRKKYETVAPGLMNEAKAPGLKEKLAVWIRGNLFIPDARCFWIKPSIRFLSRYLKDHPVDAVVSTGPPHSTHLIAFGLKKNLGLPWLADFRDPWTDIDFYQELAISKWADRKHHKLEKKVITNCDAMVVVSSGMKHSYDQMGAKNLHLVSNGYDPDDLGEEPIHRDSDFSIVHVGSIAPNRNPSLLWSVLGEICGENPEFKANLRIRLVGKVDHSVGEAIKSAGLISNLESISYLAHHEVGLVMKQSAVLLLAINNSPNAKGILTGKFFEYLAAQRPILAIGPTDGDVALVLQETRAGSIFDYHQKQELKKHLLVLYCQHKNENLNVSPEGIEKYSRRALTGSIGKILDSIISLKG